MPMKKKMRTTKRLTFINLHESESLEIKEFSSTDKCYATHTIEGHQYQDLPVQANSRIELACESSALEYVVLLSGGPIVYMLADQAGTLEPGRSLRLQGVRQVTFMAGSDSDKV